MTSHTRDLVVRTRNGRFSLQVKGEDGSLKTLHSLYDPETEARSIVNSFTCDGTGILVVLGLGLGYHLVELAKKFTDAEILVIESRHEIYELAKKHGPGFDGKIEFLVGRSPEEVVRAIAEHQTKKGIVPISVFSLSSEVSAYQGYYQPIIDSLRKTVSVKLWERLRYPKFRENKPGILLIDSGYFLVKEVEKSLKSLGCRTVKIPVKKNDDSSRVISGIIEAILRVKPDFLLTVNHLGFDEGGALASFLKSIEMPAASWYVDSPSLILKKFDGNVSPYVSLFLWDKTYLDDMKSMGFDSVNYLPLATDINVFKPVRSLKKISSYGCDVGFVGNSMVAPVDDWMSRFDKKYHPLINKVAEKIAGSKASYVLAINNLQNDERALLEMLGDREKIDFQAAVLWSATLRYRLSCIKTLEGFDMTIRGDSEWRHLLNGGGTRLSSPLNYYRELPLFYNACKINFNATSLQMREAVNQRVFDVPACSAFLLTDYQKSLDELFEVGKEIAAYESKEEIPGLVKYYLGHPREREEMAGRGRERVLKEHTYRHRLEKLIQHMKEKYK
jgi:spore maturation protein CgeB